VLLLVVLLLAVAAGVGGWWFGSGRYITAPGVLDLTTGAARAKVEAAGLVFRVGDRAYSENVANGHVVSTDPAGGERVTRHGTVTAVVSRGPERHPVPQLAGRSLADAQAALRDAHLSAGDTSYSWSRTVDKGVVVALSPDPGTRLRRNAAVDLVVSKGPKPVKVPDVTGDRASTALKSLHKLHLEASVVRRHSDTVDKGEVISQAPDSGRLLPGDNVRLVVSKGPVLVEVPEVRRMNADEATSTLRSAGFSVHTERLQYYIGLGLVVKQDPAAGERVPRGSTITIYVV
jgi:serine/threonine-protein kinase